jgi:hypothetical protein
MAVEVIDAVFRPLEGPLGISAGDLNDAVMPEVVGTVLGDITYDTVLRKIGSALANLITGIGMVAGGYFGKDLMTPRDRAWLQNLAWHHVTRVFRLACPGEFSTALSQAKEMGEVFATDPKKALSLLAKTPETLSSEFEEARSALESLIAMVKPAPAAPAGAPAPAPAPAPAVTEIIS